MKKSLLILAALFCSTTLLFAQEDTREIVTTVTFTTSTGNFDASFAVGDSWTADKQNEIMALFQKPEDAKYDIDIYTHLLYKWDEEQNKFSSLADNATLTAGKYRFDTKVKIVTYGTTHRLPDTADAWTVTVDDVAWTTYAPSISANQSRSWVTHEFTLAADPTALDNANANVQAVKRIVNGMLLIERGDRTYTLTGQAVK